jgi:hypothetical protein
VVKAVRTGTGARNAMFGHENQRASMRTPRNGTHRLTTAIATMVLRRNRKAIRRAHISSSPVVFITHHVAPSNP